MKRLKVRDKSKKQEARTAKELGGKTTIASGALVQKGDVFNDYFLVECKTTEKAFYSLKKSIWDKIQKEALNSNMRIPVMRIDIYDMFETDRKSYAVLRESDFTVFCYGKHTYCLHTVEVDNASFRIAEKGLHLVNSPIITGNAYAIDRSLLVVIDWSDFLVLAREYCEEMTEEVSEDGSENSI